MVGVVNKVVICWANIVDKVKRPIVALTRQRVRLVEEELDCWFSIKSQLSEITLPRLFISSGRDKLQLLPQIQ